MNSVEQEEQGEQIEEVDWKQKSREVTNSDVMAFVTFANLAFVQAATKHCVKVRAVTHVNIHTYKHCTRVICHVFWQLCQTVSELLRFECAAYVFGETNVI